jgi:hypothetical protein
MHFLKSTRWGEDGWLNPFLPPLYKQAKWFNVCVSQHPGPTSHCIQTPRNITWICKQQDWQGLLQQSIHIFQTRYFVYLNDLHVHLLQIQIYCSKVNCTTDIVHRGRNYFNFYKSSLRLSTGSRGWAVKKLFQRPSLSLSWGCWGQGQRWSSKGWFFHCSTTWPSWENFIILSHQESNRSYIL